MKDLGPTLARKDSLDITQNRDPSDSENEAEELSFEENTENRPRKSRSSSDPITKAGANLNPEEKAIKNAILSGKHAARSGFDRPNEQTLKEKNKYTKEQVDAYLKGFDELAGDNEKQRLRKASTAGKDAAKRGTSRPDISELEKRNHYTTQEAQAYLTAFDKHVGTEEEQGLRKAQANGKNAARKTGKAHDNEELKKRYNYNDEQIEAYLTAYNKYKGNNLKNALKRARARGTQAAKNGYGRAPEKSLQEKNYSTEEISAYFAGFDAACGNKVEQQIRLATSIGRQAAKRAAKQPTMELLKKRHPDYTSDQLNAYFKAYDEARLDETKLAKKQVINAGKQAAKTGVTLPERETLKKRNHYTDEQTDAYIKAFSENKGSEAEQAVRKAKTIARGAVRHRTTLPSKKELKEKYQFNPQQTEVFLETFTKNMDKEEAIGLSKASQAGKSAAFRGNARSTEEELKEEKQYTDLQIAAFLTAFDAAVSDEALQGIRKAATLGTQAAHRGLKTPLREQVKEKNQFTDAQVDAYFSAYTKGAGDERVQELKKVKRLGSTAARTGLTCPSKEELLKKYDGQDALVNAYLDSYDNAKGTESEQALRKAITIGQSAGRRGEERPSEKLLKQRNNYSDEQVKAYLTAFDETVGDPEEQALKKASSKGTNAARNGRYRPTEDGLKKKSGYTDTQIQVYYAAFDKVAGNEEGQGLRKAMRSGRSTALMGSARASEEVLKNRHHYTDVQIQAYNEAFDKNVGDTQTQEIRKATKAGMDAARIGLSRPLEEVVKKRNSYTTEQVSAYLSAFDDWKMKHQSHTQEAISEKPDLISSVINKEKELEILPSFKKKRVTQNISDSTQNFEVQERVTQNNNDSGQNHFEVQAGIAAKYLGIKVLPLPEPPKETAPPISFSREGALVMLSSFPFNLEKGFFKKFEIKAPNLVADYYYTSTLPQEEKEQMFFICAGRKENALVVQPKKGRCVLVLTEDEFQAMKPTLTNLVDVLVIKALNSSTHGKFKKLSLITCRRLAILLFAYFYELEHIIMLDDNISHVKFQDESQESNVWDSLFQRMRAQVENYACISISTQYKHPGSNELGSKFFMLNMQKIKERRISNKDIYLLLPDAAQAAFWGEDYLMQVMLQSHKECPPNQGYQVLDPSQFSLIRSKTHRNVFAKLGNLAAPLALLSEDKMALLTAEKQEWLTKGINTFNAIVARNFDVAKQREKYLENADLLALHAQANGIEPTILNQPSIAVEDVEFSTKLKSLIHSLEPNSQFFRNFQFEALKQVLKLEQTYARFNIATGCGKTLIQVVLACMGFHAARDGEYIVILTPQIDLVNQFYSDFLRINKRLMEHYPSFALPNEQVVFKISSDDQSVQLQTWLKNSKIKKQKSIMIFCTDSFDKLLKENIDALAQMRLILADEYPEYTSLIKKLKQELSENEETITIGSTATPPEEDPLDHDLYIYSRRRGVNDGLLAPVIADSFRVDYSIENVQKLISCLPEMLMTLCHPGFSNYTTLSSCRGVIWFPSIEFCEKAYESLNACGIKCYSIHSKNPKQKMQLKAFLESKESGLLIACDMLGIGFDDKELAFEIFARNANELDYASKNNLLQRLGRVMRTPENKEDQKIGYVLGFNNVIANIVRPLINARLNLPLSPNYLAQNIGFFLKDNQCKAIDLESKHPLVRSGHKPQFTVRPSAFEFSIQSKEDAVVEENIDDKIDDCSITAEDLAEFYLSNSEVDLYFGEC